MGIKRYSTAQLMEIKNTWVDFPLETIPEDERTDFKNKKDAVDMYINGASLSDIELKTGIKKSQISRLIKKCLSIDELGNMRGYLALIPYVSRKYNKTPGKFGTLMETHPEIAEYVEGCFFGDKRYTTEKNMNLTTLHGKFLEKCMEVGIDTYEYPFNTSNKGYNSLRTWVENLASKNIVKQAHRESKDNMQKLLSTGIGNRYTADPIAPYSVVQVDGHIIDMEYTVEIVNEDGTIDKKIATRPWLFAVIDVATRCILGYSLSQSFNYDQYVVVKAIQNAVMPHEKMNFKIKGLTYPEKDGYISFRHPELGYALFDTIMLDNAKSHLANYTMQKVINELNCAMNFGSVATPETRGIIERFFGTLETQGFHKLPFTTGSSIKDLKRRNPEKAAVKYNVTYDDLCELMEVLIAEYNCKPHSGIENQAPIDLLEKRVFEAGMVPTLADEDMKGRIERLTYIVVTRSVRGSSASGRRPYIHYEGAVYRSIELSSTMDYVGHILTLHINPDDISSIFAYDEDGTPIGYLTATGEYGKVPHSLKTRKNANKLARERGMNKNIFHSPLKSYQENLNERGQKSRKDATKADSMRRETNMPAPSESKTAKTAEIYHMPDVPTDNSTDIPSVEEAAGMTPDEIKFRLFKKRQEG